MQRIGHILEHSPNNMGQLLHGNRQATSGEYYTDNVRGYLQTTEDASSSSSFLWADAPSAEPGWDTWQTDITTRESYGLGDSVDQSAFPGFRQESGES